MGDVQSCSCQRKCSHFILMAAFFLHFYGNFITANAREARGLTLKNKQKCYERIFIQWHSKFRVKALDSISMKLFLRGAALDLQSARKFLQRLSVAGMSVFFFNFASHSAISSGAVSDFIVLLFTSFALIHFKCQIAKIPLTPRAGPPL